MVTGGFVTTVSGIRISARSPLPAFLLAASCVALWVVVASRRRGVASELDALGCAWSRRWTLLVVLTAVSAAGISIAFHTFSATGSDASGYLSYAQLLVDGRLTRPEPLAPIAKWPGGAATLVPLGWGGGLDPGTHVPTYAVGLPLILAPLLAVGGDTAASLAIPALLAIAVIAAAGIAHRLGGPLAAVLAAAWLATSPVALLHGMQVMSDVPVTAAWLTCWWLALARPSRPLLAGLAAGAAILIRPNLAPLCALPAMYMVVTSRRLRGALAFVAPVLLAGAVVASLQWLYFGSPLRSGYGTADEIFTLANVAPNARLYAEWLIDSHGPWLFAAPLTLLVVGRGRRELIWLFAFASVVVFAYLVYAVFESWTYLRFLLPALSIAMIATAVLAAWCVRRLPPLLRPLTATALVLAMGVLNLASARELGVFQLANRQARGRVVGEALAATLPVNAVIISSEQSGTMRYYTGHSIVRWDLLAPAAMPQVREWLTLNGYRVWVVLDDWEEEAFRRKFPDFAAHTIDHRPVLESAPGVGIRTRAWPEAPSAGPAKAGPLLAPSAPGAPGAPGAPS